MWCWWIFRLWNCKCRKKLVDKLVEECTEDIDDVKLARITSSEDKNNHKCSSCMLYIVLFLKFFTINVGIGIYFAYKYMNHWYLKKGVTCVEFDTCNQTIIY